LSNKTITAIYTGDPLYNLAIRHCGFNLLADRYFAKFHVAFWEMSAGISANMM